MKKRMISYFVCTALLAASPGQAVLAGLPENDSLQTENIKETEPEEEITADIEQTEGESGGETEEEEPEEQPKETEEEEPEEQPKETEEEESKEQPEETEGEKPEDEEEEKEPAEMLKEAGEEQPEKEEAEEKPEETEEEEPEEQPEETEKPEEPEGEEEEKEPAEMLKEAGEEQPEKEEAEEKQEETEEEQPEETEKEKPEEQPKEAEEEKTEAEPEESHNTTYHQTTYSCTSAESQAGSAIMYPETENLLPDQPEDDVELILPQDTEQQIESLPDFTEQPQLDENVWESREEPENEEQKEIPPLFIQNLRSFSANRSAVVPSVSVAKKENGRNLVNIELQTPEGNSVPLSCIQEDEGDYIRYQVPEITEDGQYALKVERIDDDGSSVSEKMVFSVNQQGTKFIYNEEKSEISARERYAPEVYLENVDEIAVVSCTVNGQEAAYEMEGAILRIHEEELAEGRNEISLSVRDAAGNVSRMEPWEIFRNTPVEEKITQNADSDGVFRRTGRLYPEALRRILLTTR